MLITQDRGISLFSVIASSANGGAKQSPYYGEIASLPRKGGVARNDRGFSGFTLVELLLSIAILGVLAAVVGPVLGTGIRSYALTVNRKVALGSARLAMERMASEIRLIATQNDIDTFTSSVFQFDLSTESNINYFLSGGSLQRSGVTLANNATALTFTYLDANGNSTVTKANIQRIQIELSISAGAGYGSITVRNQVFPRKFFSRYAGFQ